MNSSKQKTKSHACKPRRNRFNKGEAVLCPAQWFNTNVKHEAQVVDMYYNEPLEMYNNKTLNRDIAGWRYLCLVISYSGYRYTEFWEKDLEPAI